MIGLHLGKGDAFLESTNYDICFWEWKQSFGMNVSVWFGFQADSEGYCQLQVDSTYALSSSSWSWMPTSNPTQPTTDPTFSPTLVPSVPTSEPTPYPTLPFFDYYSTEEYNGNTVRVGWLEYMTYVLLIIFILLHSR